MIIGTARTRGESREVINESQEMKSKELASLIYAPIIIVSNNDKKKTTEIRNRISFTTVNNVTMMFKTGSKENVLDTVKVIHNLLIYQISNQPRMQTLSTQLIK